MATCSSPPPSDGVQITGTVMGLAPNSEHGFHVHAAGDCSSADFKSAGDHFNPMGVAHGAPTVDPHHPGDIPNIKADAQGTATVNANVASATLRDGGMHDLAGKALILHAKPDDYTTQPSGDSGDRIACGIIQ
jgi:superoxide dismutase, Cu-Zn family